MKRFPDKKWLKNTLQESRKKNLLCPALLKLVIIIKLCYNFKLFFLNYVVDINEVRSNTKSLHYEFGVIQDATNNFSIGNRIGQGGFGDVYKVNFSLLVIWRRELMKGKNLIVSDIYIKSI